MLQVDTMVFALGIVQLPSTLLLCLPVPVIKIVSPPPSAKKLSWPFRVWSSRALCLDT